MAFISRLNAISKPILSFTTSKWMVKSSQTGKISVCFKNITTNQPIIHEEDKVKITFIKYDHSEIVFAKGHVGDSIMAIALRENVLSSAFTNRGCCGGLMKCKECLLLFDKKNYDKFPEPHKDEIRMIYDYLKNATEKMDLELPQYAKTTNFMLRLACRVHMTKDLDGIRAYFQPIRIKIVFIKHDGNKVEVQGNVGDTLMEIAVKNKIFKCAWLCASQMDCEECLLIFSKKNYDRLPEPDDDETELLDLYIDDEMEKIVLPVPRIEQTTVFLFRMGCRIHATEDMDGIEVHLQPPKSMP